MNTPRTPASPRVRDAADQALDATTRALDSGRQFATATATRMGETARDLGESAADLAGRSVEAVGDAAVSAQRQLGQYASATRRRVERDPMKAALIAGAIGAVVTALVLANLRSRRDTD
jgi:hypothetical protein